MTRHAFKFGEFVIRRYTAEDHKSVLRIWRECGWLEHDESEPYVADFHAAGSAWIATHDENAECAATTTPGTIRYQFESLDMCVVTSVVTSHIARKRGLAKVLTAQVLAEAAQGGAEVATLGIFEQGFYDALGFGSGGYEHEITFDPATLRTASGFRIPRRITKEDWRESAAMKSRWLNHGACILEHPKIVKAELAWKENGFGLGYFNDQNELTDFFFGKLSGEYGPLEIAAIAYQNRDQLLELLALLRSLGDQISCVTLVEPAHVHLEDLLKQPFRLRRLSRGSSHESAHKACSCWQIRILDLENCLRKTRLHVPQVEFNLVLTDPIEAHLETFGKTTWRGAAGEYVVSLGEESRARRGTDERLPTLHASVNAFTRMWIGIRPASHLAISDQLQGPDSLLARLDATLRLPDARWGWQF